MFSGEPTGHFTLIRAKDPPSQGDILKECPYLIIPDDIELKEGSNNSFNIDIYDRVIIMSNSCDLDNDKIGLVLLCPVYELDPHCETLIPEKFISVGEKKKFTEKIDNFKRDILRNCREGYFLLGDIKIEGHVTGPLFIDFGNAYSLPITYIKNFVKSSKDNRIRLQVIDPVRRDMLAKFGDFYQRENQPGIDKNYFKNSHSFPWTSEKDPNI